MKKHIVLLAIIILSFALRSDAVMLIGSGSVGASSYTADDCSGTLAHSNHFEDSDATSDLTIGCPTYPCGCADVDEVGAVNGTSPTFSSTWKSDGQYSIYVSGQNYAITYLETGIDIDDIKITFDCYITAHPDTSGQHLHMIYIACDASNFIAIRIYNNAGSGIISVQRKANTNDDFVAQTAPVDTALSVVYQAKQGGSPYDHYLSVSGQTVIEQNDSIVSATATSSAIHEGDVYGNGTGSYYLDNVKVYEASDL